MTRKTLRPAGTIVAAALIALVVSQPAEARKCRKAKRRHCCQHSHVYTYQTQCCTVPVSSCCGATGAVYGESMMSAPQAAPASGAPTEAAPAPPETAPPAPMPEPYAPTPEPTESQAKPADAPQPAEAAKAEEAAPAPESKPADAPAEPKAAAPKSEAPAEEDAPPAPPMPEKDAE